LCNTERLENQTGISANWILPLEENVAVYPQGIDIPEWQVKAHAFYSNEHSRQG
jgi:hypothetical protein